MPERNLCSQGVSERKMMQCLVLIALNFALWQCRCLRSSAVIVQWLGHCVVAAVTQVRILVSAFFFFFPSFILFLFLSYLFTYTFFSFFNFPVMHVSFLVFLGEIENRLTVLTVSKQLPFLCECILCQNKHTGKIQRLFLRQNVN